MVFQMESDMVSLRDLHFDSVNLVQEEELK